MLISLTEFFYNVCLDQSIMLYPYFLLLSIRKKERKDGNKKGKEREKSTLKDKSLLPQILNLLIQYHYVTLPYKVTLEDDNFGKKAMSSIPACRV